MVGGVDAGAVVGAAAARFDGGLLAADDAGAADRELAEMNEMPVGQIAVDREILRHRPKHDAVARRDAAHRDRTEQQRALIDRGAQPSRMIGGDLHTRNVHHSVVLNEVAMLHSAVAPTASRAALPPPPPMTITSRRCGRAMSANPQGSGGHGLFACGRCGGRLVGAKPFTEISKLLPSRSVARVSA